MSTEAPNTGTDSIAELTERVVDFVRERDWSRFHDPKNLSMLVGSEAGELMGILRWVSGDEADAFAADPVNRRRIAEEIADVSIALLLLCERLGLSLGEVIQDKLLQNAVKYPAAEWRGRAHQRTNG